MHGKRDARSRLPSRNILYAHAWKGGDLSSLEELMVFRDVVLTGNITRTSQRLHMSQSSVSIQIRNLEREYGAQLFDRTNRGVRLTERGEVLYRYAEEVVNLMLEAREAVPEGAFQHRKNIDIGATFTIGEYIIPLVAREYYCRSTDDAIGVRIADTETLAWDVIDRRLRLALVEGPVPNDPNLVAEAFWQDELVVVAPVDHPWGRRETISIEQLKTEKMITREQGSGTRRVMELALARNGLDYCDLDIRIELGSTQAIKQAVRCGMGIAIISILAVQEECGLGRFAVLRVEDCPIVRSLSILTHAKGRLSAEERSFADLLGDRKTLQRLFPPPFSGSG